VRLVNGGIGFEAALTVLVLAPELYLPLRNLAAQYHASADGLAVSERLLELADVPPAAGVAQPPSPREAVVRLEGVSFSYPARDEVVLEAIDLELAPGELVALVGPSGGGKSTIAALLLGLAEPTAGRVCVGAVDLSSCDAAAWRSQVAWVPQSPTLFRDTVAGNIRLGDPAAGDERVRAAAEAAGAAGFIQALPGGYDTLVGDGGRALSAGQRQRIALARAFLRDAPLLVLDEPTANLDPASAGTIAAAIERFRRGRTVLLIAHRPELTSGADRIVRLESGRLAGEPAVVAA
jgi:ABC-type multidrug transport system fused ATPase/permease subunit